MRIDDAFQRLHAIHVEATGKRDMGAVAEVSQRYDELLNQAPDAIEVLFASATAHMQLGRNGVAIALFQKALNIQDLPEIWNNLGTAYKAENLNEPAEKCWLEALKRREDADYYNNLATLYVNEGRPAEGLPYIEKGLALNPNHDRLRWNQSLLNLELGNWREGFSGYDAGFASMDRPNRMFSNDPKAIPFWDGTPGKRVVVYGEQGIGDEILYASAIPDLMKQCEVVLECHPRLVGVFERSFGIKCYGTRKSNTLEWPKSEHLDAKLAIGSLFRLYRSDGAFPRQTYLSPDAGLVAHYRKRLEAAGQGPYVGIGWNAGTKSTRNDLRSLKLKAFDPLFDAGGTFVSLQYSADAQRKVDQYKADTGRVIHHWPEVVESGPEDGRHPGFDYDHTLALLCALDLVIVPNTTAVHACGALGVECWTITPDAPAWRYQLSGDSMPFYGDWVKQYRGSGALERIARDYRMRRGSWAQSAKQAVG